jgi:DNA-binding transcriptional regulator YdaS (Cro superfamily)
MTDDNRSELDAEIDRAISKCHRLIEKAEGIVNGSRAVTAIATATAHNAESKGAIMTRDSGLKAAIKSAGGTRRLAALLDISPSAVAQWHHVPAERLIQVETETGVPRHILRPDLFQQTTETPATQRQRLPNRRASENFDFTAQDLKFTATFSRDADGEVREVFLRSHKVTSMADINASDASVV